MGMDVITSWIALSGWYVVIIFKSILNGQVQCFLLIRNKVSVNEKFNWDVFFFKKFTTRSSCWSPVIPSFLTCRHQINSRRIHNFLPWNPWSFLFRNWKMFLKKINVFFFSKIFEIKKYDFGQKYLNFFSQLWSYFKKYSLWPNDWGYTKASIEKQLFLDTLFIKHPFSSLYYLSWPPREGELPCSDIALRSPSEIVIFKYLLEN